MNSINPSIDIARIVLKNILSDTFLNISFMLNLPPNIQINIFKKIDNINLTKNITIKNVKVASPSIALRLSYPISYNC